MYFKKINAIIPIYILIIASVFISSTEQFDVDEVDSYDIQDEDLSDETDENPEPVLSDVVTDVNKTITTTKTYTPVSFANVSLNENKTQTSNETRKVVKCKGIIYENEEIEPSVEIVNASSLAKLLQMKPDIASPSVEAECVLVFFHAKSCPFSAHAAPHFNALARSYPNIKMVALDALKYHGINALYGIVGVPTLKLFHNGRAVGKFNGTEHSIHFFSKFIQTLTGHTPQGLLVTSKDFQGPVSSVVEFGTDYFLILSWLFIIGCAIYYFMQSKWWNMIIEMIQNNWRESEAQHEHND